MKKRGRAWDPPKRSGWGSYPLVAPLSRSMVTIESGRNTLAAVISAAGIGAGQSHARVLTSAKKRGCFVLHKFTELLFTTGRQPEPAGVYSSCHRSTTTSRLHQAFLSGTPNPIRHEPTKQFGSNKKLSGQSGEPQASEAFYGGGLGAIVLRPGKKVVQIHAQMPQGGQNALLRLLCPAFCRAGGGRARAIRRSL